MSRIITRMHGMQILQAGLIILIALFSLTGNCWAKSGSVSVASPLNNISVSSNFNASIGYTTGWVNGIQDTSSTCGLVNPTTGLQSGKLQKLDFYYNSSNNTYIVSQLKYTIDGINSKVVKDILSNDTAYIPVNIDVNSLANGNHSANFNLQDVYSTRCYYDSSCTSCHGQNYVTTAWQRVDGSSIANATLSFSVTKPVSSAPSLSSPASKFSTGSTSATSAGFSWASVTNATSYELDIFDSATPSNITKRTPSGTTDSISNLLPMHKYSWNVAGVNSVGKGPVSETRQFIVAECWPDVGTGYGYFNFQSQIETCYDLSSYLLKDISRRANLNVDGHNGNMAPSASITTQVYNSSTPLADPDNNWVDATLGRPAGVDAHVNTAKVYDYLLSQLGLSSPDGQGGSMINIVESLDDTDNAWFYPDAPTPTIQYSANTSYSSVLGIVGHEWGHAVTQRAAGHSNNGDGLGASKEGGAMDEAFSDWIGTAINQANSDSSWKIVIGDTTRNLADPRSSINPKQPDVYGGPVNWIDTSTACIPNNSNDDCGVHQNNGVPNKMFYLLASPGEKTFNNVTVTGIGIDKAIKVAYLANTDFWKTTPNPLIFRDARDGMIAAAKKLFGSTSTEAVQVENAWKAVGVTGISTPQFLAMKRALMAILLPLLL